MPIESQPLGRAGIWWGGRRDGIGGSWWGGWGGGGTGGQTANGTQAHELGRGKALSVSFFEEHPEADTGNLLPRHLLKEVLMTHEEKDFDKLETDVKKGKARHELSLLARDHALVKLFPVPKAKPKLVKAKAKASVPPPKPPAPAWIARPNDTAVSHYRWYYGLAGNFFGYPGRYLSSSCLATPVACTVSCLL